MNKLFLRSLYLTLLAFALPVMASADNVAKIGTTEYATLADAVAAVPTDGTATTITMIADETIVGNSGITIATGKNVILDLNGKTVTGNTDSGTTYALVTNKGTLTIQDASGTGKLEVNPTNAWVYSDADPSGYASNLIRNEGTLTVESGYLSNNGNGSACYAIDNYSAGNVTINGGNITTAKASAIRLFYNNGGSLTVTDGIIGSDNTYMGIQVMSGTNATVSVSGGSITGQYALYANNSGGSIAISGGEYNGYVGFGSAGPNDISISGGTFNDGVGTLGTQTGFITGGTFSEPVNPDLCVSGKKCVEENGEYLIVDDSDPREPAGEFVYYYWYVNNQEQGETCEFSTPFTKNWLCDGEYIQLLTNITLTEDIACQLESGSFTLTQGTYSVTKGSYSVTLKAGVSVVTDKQTDIFTAEDATNYTITETESNGTYTYTVTALPKVAQIGDIQYTSLAAAIAAVPTDGTQTTITMIADETIVGNGVTIAAGNNVILDLNGHTISQTGPMSGTSWLIKNQGTLTIKDATDTNKDGTGNGKMTCSAEDPDTGDIPSYANNLVSNYGTLNIESGFFQVLTNAGYASYVVDNYSGGTANISGGKLTNTAESAYVVRMFLNSTTANNALNISGTANITGTYAVWMQYANGNANKASLNISGGNIEATSGYSVYAGAAGGNTRNASNVTVNISGGNMGGTGVWLGADTEFESISVSGGTFANFGASAVGGSGFITGGTFTNTSLFTQTRNENSPILAEGFSVVGDGPYAVEQTSVAKIGTTYYATLEAAFAAAQDGETITLLSDCSGNGIKVPQGTFTTGLTVDFGGFTYTIDGNLVGSTGTQTQAFQLLKNNTITFQNGTIYSENAKMLIQNYSNLTLDGMTLTLNNSSYSSAYTLSNNNGNVVIDNTTINANPAGGFAFDVCRYASYPSVNVTVTGTSVINGDVEIYASGSDAKDGFSLTLEDGTITGDIVIDATAAAAMEATPAVATVTKADAFSQDAPEGYEWTDNGDGTSTLAAITSYTITDGQAYTFSKDIEGVTATYVRSFASNRVNKYQGWFVPFDYTITAADLEKFRFFQINMIAHTAKEGETEDASKLWVHLIKMSEGDVLKANKPYVFTPLEEMTDHEFTSTDATLKAVTTDAVADCSTLTEKFDFYGVYTSANMTSVGSEFYYMNINGEISRATKATTTVGANRWIFTVTSKEGDKTSVTYSPTFNFVVDGDDDDVTVVSSATDAAVAEGDIVGYYTLNGQKVSEPGKGVYVVKYANGTSKKVVF